ncbi:MAG: SDR family NAD(P)-dependent oxidoreductase [Polyangiales bacterium]
MRALTLITGAASGLGRELAAQLARRGERLVLWDRDRERLERTVTLLGPSVVHSDVVDVVNGDATREAAERSVDAAGPINRAIHCAAVMRVGPSLTMSATDYRATIETNYLGSVNVARALTPVLLDAGRRGGPSELVFIASVAALRGVPSLAGYSASKHAVVGFAEALREELSGEPIRVRVVCPPPAATSTLLNMPELPPLFHIVRPQPVDKIAADVLRALERKHDLVLLDLRAKAVAWAQRLVPSALAHVLKRAARR